MSASAGFRARPGFPPMRPWQSLSTWARVAADRAGMWADARARALAAHPARLVWTLIVTLAYVAAVHPLWSYAHAWWWSARSLFLNNSQVDYGEGPLFNQEVLLYHGVNFYRLDNAPPFTVGNYPPVFPLVASIFMHFTGQTFEAGRLVSSLAIVGAATMIGLTVLQTTRQVVAAFTAGALLFTFSGIDYWGPLNRVDSLALFWSTTTVFLAVRYAGSRKVWWVVPFTVLTIYTRQSLVDGLFAAYLYLALRDWRRTLWMGLAAAGLAGAVFVGLQIWSHGAFYLNTVVDNENAWNWGTVVQSWGSWMRNDGGRVTFRLALAGAGAGLLGPGGVLWPAWLAAGTAVFATIGKVGSSVNYYFPVYAATAACLGVFIARFRTFFRRAPFPLWPTELLLPLLLFVYIHGAPPSWVTRVPLGDRLEQAVHALTTWTLRNSQVARQAAQLRPQWARHQRPTPARATMPVNVQQMVAYLRGVRGPVLALGYPDAVQVQAGHELQWQPFELTSAQGDGHWNGTPFIEAVRHRYYAVIFFNNSDRGALDYGPPGLRQAIQENYRFQTRIANWQIWTPDGPPVPLGPAPPPSYLPHPLPDALHGVVRLLLSLPERLTQVLSAPKATAIAGIREVDLGRQFNLRGVIDPGHPSGQSLDGGGSSFAADIFPRSGTLTVDAGGQRVPFLIPPTGSRIASVLALDDGARIALPAQKDTAVWLLEAGVNGNQSGQVTLRFASGPSRTASVRFTDWCLQPSPPEYPAYRAPYRLNAEGERTAPSCGLFAERLPVDASRPLVALEFAPTANARLVAVSVQKA